MIALTGSHILSSLFTMDHKMEIFGRVDTWVGYGIVVSLRCVRVCMLTVRTPYDRGHLSIRVDRYHKVKIGIT